VESLRLLRQKALESAAAQRLEQTLEVRATVDVSRESLRFFTIFNGKNP
jgi:hypothetical protein